MGGTLKKLKKQGRKVGVSSTESNRDYNDNHYDENDPEDDPDDIWASEINRINHRSSAPNNDRNTRSNQRSNRGNPERRRTTGGNGDGGGYDQNGYYYDNNHNNSDSAEEDVPAMEAFARRVLTPRPLSVEPSLDLDGSSLIGGDDHYFTPAERKRYEQAIPVTMDENGRTMSPIYSPDQQNETINWKRGELLGSGAFGNVYLGLNLDTGELMGAKQISLGPTSTAMAAGFGRSNGAMSPEGKV